MGDKNRAETTITIILGIFAIVSGLAAFWTSVKNAASWIANNISVLWTIAILAFVGLLATIVYWLVVKKGYGRAVFEKIIGVVDLRFVFIFLVLINGFCWGVLAQRCFSRIRTRNIQGTIYYTPSENKPGLDPVPDVTVSFDHFKSEPTDPAGRFIIQDVPINFQVTDLKATVGGLDYTTTYNQNGIYPVIARQLDEAPRFRREITSPWVEVAFDRCPTENSLVFANKKKFILNTRLGGDPGVEQTYLVVALGSQANFVVLNAFVVSPPEQLELYRNAMKGIDSSKAHRWIFYPPKDGLNVQIQLCLGSNENSADPWQQHLYIYELQ